MDLKPSLMDAQYEKAIEQYQQEYSQKKGPIEHQVALPPSGAAQVRGHMGAHCALQIWAGFD